MTDENYTPNSLADHLDDLLPPGKFDVPVVEDDPLVEAALSLVNAPRPELPPPAMTRIQVQVMQAHRQRIRPPRIRFPQPYALRWAVAASLVLVFLVGGLTPLAFASVPGDALYPLKQAAEQVELALATTPATEAALRLTRAERRLQEGFTLLERGELPPQLVAQTLGEMVTSAVLLRADTVVNTTLQRDLESRTLELTTLLDTLLSDASFSGALSSEAFLSLQSEVTAVANSGNLLLPVTAPAEETLPTIVVIEGPVEAIDGNTIIVYGIRIVLDPSDPVLATLQVGDFVHIEGTFEGAEVVGGSASPIVEFVAVETDIIESPPAQDATAPCSGSACGDETSRRNGPRGRGEGSRRGNGRGGGGD